MPLLWILGAIFGVGIAQKKGLIKPILPGFRPDVAPPGRVQDPGVPGVSQVAPQLPIQLPSRPLITVAQEPTEAEEIASAAKMATKGPWGPIPQAFDFGDPSIEEIGL